jgi:hypothetical protein
VDLRTIEQFAIPTCPVPQAEQGLNEEFEGEFTFQGDDIDKGSIDNASVLPSLECNVLQFLQTFLLDRLGKDGDLVMQPPDGTTWPIIGGCVEHFLKLFFCREDWIARCRSTPSAIDKQVELWNFLAKLTPDHRYDDWVTKVISIISIPASEASCERTLSRQKRIITHMRARSSPKLAPLRLTFLEFDLPLRE